MAVPAVLFDLDGCLADSRATIVAAWSHALAVHGYPPMSVAAIEAYIGPPTRVAFAEALDLPAGDPALEAVIATYRERYAVALRDTRTFPGVPEAVDALRAAGLRLAVATSKPRRFALPVLGAIGLDDRFDAVAGPALTGTASKAETMGEAIAALGPETTPVAMVGDRRHDVEGAKAHGLLAVGVLWGMGSRTELETAGADVLVDAPGQLVAVLTEVASATRASRRSSTATTGP